MFSLEARLCLVVVVVVVVLTGASSRRGVAWVCGGRGER